MLRRHLMTSALMLLGAAFAAAQTGVPAVTPSSSAPPAPRRAASPSGTAATQVGGTWSAAEKDSEPRYSGGKWIEIVYSRPVLRGRTDIFGKGADYGKKVNGGAPVWRAGANQTTRLKTEVPLEIGGNKVPREYSLFMV
jgi:hypothetical protein